MSLFEQHRYSKANDFIAVGEINSDSTIEILQFPGIPVLR